MPDELMEATTKDFLRINENFQMDERDLQGDESKVERVMQATVRYNAILLKGYYANSARITNLFKAVATIKQAVATNNTSITNLRTNMATKSEMGNIKTELKGDINNLQAELNTVNSNITIRTMQNFYGVSMLLQSFFINPKLMIVFFLHIVLKCVTLMWRDLDVAGP